MRSTNRWTWRHSSALALCSVLILAAGSAAAGDRWDYWDPRASIPARVIDTHLGVIGLAATIAGDYRTAAVVDHLSGRFPGGGPVVQNIYYPPPVVEHVYYPPPVVEHVYYPPPPVIVHHVHGSGCGHSGDGYGYRYGQGYGQGYDRRYDRGYGRGHRRGHGHHRGHQRRHGHGHGGWDD